MLLSERTRGATTTVQAIFTLLSLRPSFIQWLAGNTTADLDTEQGSVLAAFSAVVERKAWNEEHSGDGDESAVEDTHFVAAVLLRVDVNCGLS